MTGSEDLRLAYLHITNCMILSGLTLTDPDWNKILEGVDLQENNLSL